MRRLIPVILIVMVTSLFLLFAQGGKIDLSGEWALNEGKSDMGEGRGRFVSSKLVISQEPGKIKIERTGQGRNGEFTRTEELTLDGKENELEGFGGNVRTVTANWTDVGKSLTIASSMTFERNGNSMEISTTEVWSLSENILTIAATMSSPRGERKSTLVYDKVE